MKHIFRSGVNLASSRFSLLSLVIIMEGRPQSQPQPPPQLQQQQPQPLQAAAAGGRIATAPALAPPAPAPAPAAAVRRSAAATVVAAAALQDSNKTFHSLAEYRAAIDAFNGRRRLLRGHRDREQEVVVLAKKTRGCFGATEKNKEKVISFYNKLDAQCSLFYVIYLNF